MVLLKVQIVMAAFLIGLILTGCTSASIADKDEQSGVVIQKPVRPLNLKL